MIKSKRDRPAEETLSVPMPWETDPRWLEWANEVFGQWKADYSASFEGGGWGDLKDLLDRMRPMFEKNR